jgi:hypothetical protein
MTDKLAGIDVEGSFWKAAATLWPDIQKAVIYEWMAGRGQRQAPGDLKAPDLNLQNDFPQTSIHTEAAHSRIVLTSMLPADDAYHLYEALEHYFDHGCDESADILDGWLEQALLPLLREYYQKFAAPVPPLFEDCDGEDYE